MGEGGGETSLSNGEAWADADIIRRAGSGGKGSVGGVQIEVVDDRGAVYRGRGGATPYIFHVRVINVIFREVDGAGDRNKVRQT